MGLDDYDEELRLVFEELEEEGLLVEGTPAYGIAQMMIDRSYDDLSPKQRFIYDKEVAPLVAAKLEEWRMNEIMNSAPD